MTTNILDRAARPPDQTGVYGEDPVHIVDWFGTSESGGGLVILLHGGFWRNRYDRRHLYPLAEALADAGILVALPEYRRIGDPGGGWEGTFTDVQRIIDVVPPLARELFGDAAVTAGVTVAGHSAGGHLAVRSQAAGADPASLPRTLVDRVVSLAGVLDVSAAHALGLSNNAVGEFLGQVDDVLPDAALRGADPMRLPVPVVQGVEVLLIHGAVDQDVPAAFSRSYAERDERIVYTEPAHADHYDLIDPLSSTWPTVLGALSWPVR